MSTAALEISQPRKEELLQLVQELVDQLQRVEVMELRNPRQLVENGLPRSCLGSVTAFLERHDDLAQYREFLQRLHHLDRMTAQNQRTPKAQHKALQGVLVSWLAKNPGLSAREWLYVLAWTQRHLPAKIRTQRRPTQRSAPRRDRTTDSEPSPSPRQGPELKGNVMAAKLRAALEKKSKESTDES